MTEQGWLRAEDPGPMLEFLRGKAGKRKCLLFACACERRMWGHPHCEREKVEVTERYADAEADAAELLAALRDIGIDGVTLASVTEMDPLAWAYFGADDSAEFAANVAVPPRVTTNEAEDEPAWDAAYAVERAVQAGLLRCVFGNPFRPVALDPAWRTWHDGLVVSLARRMYESRDFGDLPVLADALEEAGCSDPAVLSHCRLPGEHVRGCWVVDLVLGKS